MHSQFSSETVHAAWKVLPAMESFIQSWRDLAKKDDFAPLEPAITHGLQTAEKYFGVATRSSAQIMNLCKFYHYTWLRVN